jgi:Zn-dependent protease with chaperone function
MTVGAALFVYAVLLGTLGPLAYRRDGWLARAPRLGATLLLTAGWSVLAALFLAGLTVALPATALSSGLSHLLDACIVRLRAAYVTPGGAAVAGAGLTLSGVIALRVARAVVQLARARRAERRRHRTLVALCGTHAELDAVIIDHPQPAAYCLADRSDTVILTSSAIALLTPPQVAAVLAHEQAHLGARHHRLLAAAAFAGRALPELPLLRELTAQVRPLLEMHADDLAARSHDPETLPQYWSPSAPPDRAHTGGAVRRPGRSRHRCGCTNPTPTAATGRAEPRRRRPLRAGTPPSDSSPAGALTRRRRRQPPRQADPGRSRP